MKTHLNHKFFWTRPLSPSACRLALHALVLGMAGLFPSRALSNTAESQLAGDAGGASALVQTTNWTPATAVAPTNILATTFDYTSSFTLRTPQNQNSYTVNANSLTLNSGGALGCKGSNVITIPNLILNGGRVANSGTSGNPDMARLAGSINLTANSSIAVNGAGTFVNLLSTITNSGAAANLTCTSSGTVILSGQNTFTGTIIVNNTATSSTILQLGINNATPSTATIQLNAGTGAPSRFDLNGFNTTIANLNITSGTVVGFVTNSALATTSTLTLSNNSTVSVNNGTITDNPGGAGTVALAKLGSGTLNFNTSEGYHGSTTIGAGTLALDATGSISNSPSISIDSGATFDVSAIASYTLNSTTFSASGTGTTMGLNAATINGASGGSVSLGAQPINLAYTPTTFNGDANDAALLVSQGDLTLNNNSFTVNNASGTPLEAGTYLLIQVTDGNINQSGSPSYALTVTGSGLAAQTTSAIQVSGGNVNLVVMANANPNPTFSNLTGNQTVTYGTASVTLSGKVSASGPIYPASGEPVTVSINGNLQATTINDNTGDFSIDYNLSGIPAGGTPYTITYSYGGDSSLGSATDTSKTLTVQPATPVFSGLTPSQTVSYGTAGVTLSGKVSVGSVYPAVGEKIAISIDGNPQTNTINDTTGDFSFSYNLLSIPFNAASYTITYSYGGDDSLNSAVDTSTTITVETNTITENLASADPINTSSLNTSPNWTPATTEFPTDPSATNYDFVAATSLRTPTNSDDFVVVARSLTINPGGALTFKGTGTVTISNLVLNGGLIKNASTGGSPDESLLAGFINLTASSSLTPDALVTSIVNIESVITNAAGSDPTLTCSSGGTVILSAQNTFGGNIVVSGAGAGLATILQLGTNNALPAGTSLTLNGGSGSTGPGILDLNGFNTTITNLTFSSTGPNFGYVMNSAAGTTGTLTLGNSNTTETLQFGTTTGSPISAGTVALAKIGNGTLTVDTVLSHEGNTSISAGTLALGSSGSIPNSAEIIIASNATFDVSQTAFDLGASQILTGSGSVNGSLQADGTISPVGTLSIDGDLTINGNLMFTLNKSLAQRNDVVSVSGALDNTGSGTLTVSNLGPGLVPGDTFALFNQPLINGNNLTIIAPPNIVLTNNLALNGTVTVVSAPVTSQPHFTNISLSGGDVIISGTNGSAGQQFEVLSSTNVSLPLSNWTSLATNTFSGGNFSATNAVNAGEPRRFYIIRVP